MTAATVSTTYAIEESAPRNPRWWVLLLTGIAWIIIGVVVLDADVDSAVTIGYLVAGYFIAGAIMEFVLVGVVEGWKWLHVILGILFVLGGIAALTTPFQTYMVLASLVGFFLVLKGTFDFVMALAVRHDMDLWWLLLISGIIELLLGFWASGYPGRSSWLLILWIGLGAVMRGITQMVLAFRIRKHPEALV